MTTPTSVEELEKRRKESIELNTKAYKYYKHMEEANGALIELGDFLTANLSDEYADILLHVMEVLDTMTDLARNEADKLSKSLLTQARKVEKEIKDHNEAESSKRTENMMPIKMYNQNMGNGGWNA